MYKKRFALALLAGLGMSGAAQATLLLLPPPWYQGLADVAVLPSVAPGASYLSSAAGVRRTDGSNASTGGSSTPTSDSIGLTVAETGASAFYGAEAGTLHVAGSTSTGALGNTLLPGHLAGAFARAGYGDSVLVQGPAGVSVGNATLQFTLAVDGSLFVSVPGSGGVPNSGQAQVNASLSVTSANCYGASPACGAISFGSTVGNDMNFGYYTHTSGSPVESFSVTAAYGTLLSLNGDLYVDDSTNTYATGGYSASSDYSNTMHTYIDVQTPGVSLLTSSGHDYSRVAAVPEPFTLALLGVGLAGMGWVRRRGSLGA